MLRTLGATQIGNSISNDFTWISLDLDAFTNASISVQLFIHGVNARFEVTEGLNSMNGLLGTALWGVFEPIMLLNQGCQ